jgi:hypothetical protein
MVQPLHRNLNCNFKIYFTARGIIQPVIKYKVFKRYLHLNDLLCSGILLRNSPSGTSFILTYELSGAKTDNLATWNIAASSNENFFGTSD